MHMIKFATWMQTPLKHSDKGSSGPAFKNKPRSKRGDGSSINTEGHLRDSKRQKKLNSSNCEARSDAGIDKYVSSKTGSELESRPPPQSADDKKESSHNSFLCAFCSSSMVSEVVLVVLIIWPLPLLLFLLGRSCAFL